MRYLRSAALLSLFVIVSLLPRRIKRALLPERIAFYGHLISDGDHPASVRYRYPSTREFGHFVVALQRMGFRFSSLPDFLVGDGTKKVALTFDDGFAEIGRFIAGQRLLTPEVFTLFVGGDGTAPYAVPGLGMEREPHLFLTDVDLQRLRLLGVHIGYHGQLHVRLPESYGEEDVQNLLGRGASRPERLSTPLAFAYPYTAPRRRDLADRLVRDRGFEVIFGTGFDWASPSIYERISLDVAKSIPRFLNPCIFQLNVLMAKRLLGAVGRERKREILGKPPGEV